MIAVEVRHATLNTHDRSGGPAQNTEHTSSQEEKEKEKKEKEKEKTHIKSNNPHLTGGEQEHLPQLPVRGIWLVPLQGILGPQKKKLAVSVQSGCYEAVSTGIAFAGPGNRAHQIGQMRSTRTRVRVNRVKINQNFMKWLESDITNHLSTHINSSNIIRKFVHHLPPKKQKT